MLRSLHPGSGFYKLYSTEMALLTLPVNSWEYTEYTVLVLLDLSSAFDTFDHNLMINRLRDLVGMSGTSYSGFLFTFLAEVSVFL